MTATDRGRRSDALYYDNVGMQRRRLCDMVANLESDNAELREERDMYRDLVGMMDHPDLNAQLQAENDKLRELIRDMYTPPVDMSLKGLHERNEDHLRRARELGIEVDE